MALYPRCVRCGLVETALENSFIYKWDLLVRQQCMRKESDGKRETRGACGGGKTNRVCRASTYHPVRRVLEILGGFTAPVLRRSVLRFPPR